MVDGPVEELKDVIRELARKYPDAQPAFGDMVWHAEEVQHQAGACDYDKMQWSSQQLGRAHGWVHWVVEMNPDDAMKLNDALHKFNREMADLLKRRCGCR